jgi:uncharacterized protein YjiS (DUF1127 family)
MFVHRLFSRVRAWRERQATIRALQALSTSELDDLQIGRWQIGEIARGARF